MTPSARIEACVDLLSEVINETQPADVLINKFFRQNRYIGSNDRRDISQRIYHILRNWEEIKWVRREVAPTFHETARLLVLIHMAYTEKQAPPEIGEVFSGGKYCPKLLNDAETQFVQAVSEFKAEDMPFYIKLNVPEEMVPFLRDAFGERIEEEMKALNKQAPLDLRVNSLKATREVVSRALSKEGIQNQKTPLSPFGLRLPNRRPLAHHKLWKDGMIEVQDEGSQLIALLCSVKPGMRVLDYCAGAGGKTLALAAQMENKGNLIASDILQWRLSRAKERLKRAGVHNAEQRLIGPDEKGWFKRQRHKFDRVLVDAPCSGSGTWRRNPDLKWRFSPKTIQELLKKQATILDEAALYVKSGGHLIYSTCSVYPQENQKQIDAFLERNPEYQQVPIQEVWSSACEAPCPVETAGLNLTPAKHQTDGFFVAVLAFKAS